MRSGIEARVTHRFKASPERVFDAWIRPDSARRWLKAALMEMGLAGDIRRVEVDPRVGGAFFFSDQRGDEEARHWGRYLEVDRPRRLAFTWITDPSEESKLSTVTVTIKPDGDGCVATLVHEMDAAWAEYRSRTEQSWSRMLGAIAHLAETPDP